MFVSPDSWTVSRPSNTAVGISTGSSNLFAIALLLLSTHNDNSAFAPAVEEEQVRGLARLGEQRGEELLLGGGEDLFVGESVEGELVSLFAHEYCASGAPVLFGTEDNQLLSATFARKDDLLLLWKMLHLYAPP
jgi:hypothetical protein